MTTMELIEKHDIGFNCLSDAYDLGRADAIDELYNEILYIENKFRSMLVNTSQEDIFEWLDLNGKLMAITTIKHLIVDKLKEQKR